MPLFPAKLTAAVATAGLLVGGAALAAPADAAARHRATVNLHSTAKHHVVAPGTIAPGLVHLHNTGAGALYLFGGKHATAAMLIDVLNGRGKPADAKRFKIVDLMAGHDDIMMRLDRGTYFVVDVEVVTRFTSSSVKTLHVSGRTVNTKAPASSGVTVDRHDTLHSPSVVSRHRWLRLTNRTGRTQEIGTVKIGSGTSDAELAEFIAAPSVGRLEKLDIVGGGLFADLPAHRSMYYHLHASPGRYVALAIAVTKSDPTLGKGDVHKIVLK